MRSCQIADKKLFSPRRGRIALSANERIAEFLNFAIQAKFAYVNKLKPAYAGRISGVLQTLLQRFLQHLREIQALFKSRIVKPFGNGQRLFD